MKRPILALGLAATALLTFSACGSDSSTSSPSKAGADTTTAAASGDTMVGGGDITIPNIGNLTEECKAIALSFSKAMAQAFVPNGQSLDLEKVFGDVQSKVPDDLKDDVAVISAAVSSLAKVMQENGNDMTSGAVQQAIRDLGTPDVEAASNNIQAYFDKTCPN